MPTSKKGIDIVINNFRRLHYLGYLINAIEERTDFPHRIIVVNNCSIPETWAYVEALKNNGRIWKSVHNEKNYPLSQAFKKGFELVESEYCVLALDDMIPPWTNPCWLTHLDYLIRNNPEYGAITLRQKKWESKKYFAREWNRIDFPLEENGIEERQHGVEERFQIAKTSDLKEVGFATTNVGIYYLATRMKELFNKKIGITTQSRDTKAPSWRDENYGYEYDVPERFKFEI